MPRTILLADDSVTAQNMGRRILSDAGYEVITVNNGSAALKKVAESAPDLIVLDVYMPGYGGLEVCQRLKESQATSRIPVLLTVGKLEPFKVEEARRVRADAHIIKPFDSTELLAAIIKLEDKIVPQAASGKQSRSSRNAGEGTSPRRGRDKSTDAAGETTSGWRRRLSIPRSVPPPEVPAGPNKSKNASGKFQDPATDEGSKSTEAELPAPVVSAGSEEPSAISESIVSVRPFENFTVERLMAIETAAPIINPAPSAEDIATEPKSMPADGDQVPESGNESFSETKALSIGPTSTDPISVNIVSAESVPADPVSADPVSIDAVPVSKTEPVRTEQSPREDEVMAALASLSPVSSQSAFDVVAAATSVDSELKFSRLGEDIPVDALVSALTAVAGISSGPRWIAEAVPLSDGEAHLILESEMEKVYASVSAAETVEANDRAVSDAIESAPTMAEQSLPDHNPAETEVIACEVQVLDSNCISATLEASTVEETAVAAASVSSLRAESEPEPVTTFEVKVPVVAESSDQGTADASIGYREIAYAAAASAGSAGTSEAGRRENISSAVEFPVNASGSASLNVHTEATGETDSYISIRTPEALDPEQALVAQVNSPGEAAAANGESERHESQGDAAWQDWRQIRDAVVGPQLTSQIADVAAAGFRQLREEEGLQAAPQEADAVAEGKAAEQAAAQASTIASIVDSVFAELKPKLMEEIAKKLAADRK